MGAGHRPGKGTIGPEFDLSKGAEGQRVQEAMRAVGKMSVQRQIPAEASQPRVEVL